MALGGFTSAVLSRRRPPPLYHLASPPRMTQHVARSHGWEERGAEREPLLQNLFIGEARPLVDLVRRLIRVLSSILAGRFVPSLRLVRQPRAPPAYHYQASGPYCITDGADRRERRQPACFLERRGVCS